MLDDRVDFTVFRRLEAHAPCELREGRKHDRPVYAIDDERGGFDAANASCDGENRMQVPADGPHALRCHIGRIMSKLHATKFERIADAINHPIGRKRSRTAIVISLNETNWKRTTLAELCESFPLEFPNALSRMRQIANDHDDFRFRAHCCARKTNQRFFVDTVRRRYSKSAIGLALSDMNVGHDKRAHSTDEERTLRHEIDEKARVRGRGAAAVDSL